MLLDLCAILSRQIPPISIDHSNYMTSSSLLKPPSFLEPPLFALNPASKTYLSVTRHYLLSPLQAYEAYDFLTLRHYRSLQP